MSTLEQLFPHGRRDDAATDGQGAPNRQGVTDRLHDTVGAPRSGWNSRTEVADVGALRLTVAQAAADASSTPVSAVPGGGGVLRRRRRRVDVLSVAVSGLAIVSIMGAVLVGGVQAASASPATAAVKLLEQDEATLINLETALQTNVTTLIGQRDEALASARALQASLGAIRETPDPRSDESEPELIDIFDPAGMADVDAALSGYITALDAWAAPALPDPYRRGSIDTDSLAEVGEGIETVQAELGALDEVSATVSDAGAELTSLSDALVKRIETFASNAVGRAAWLVEQNPDAEAELHDALMAAADVVATSDLLEGSASLGAFRDSVLDLVIDQRQAELEAEERARQEEEERRQEERRRERERQEESDSDGDAGDDEGWQPGEETPPADPDGSDGGTGPTDPGEPSNDPPIDGALEGFAAPRGSAPMV